MSGIGNRYALVPAQALMIDQAAPGAVVDLRGIFRALRRRWFWVVGPALMTGGIVLAVVMSLNARYDATAKVLLDPRGLQVFQNDLRPNNTTGDETGADVESQVQVIASTSLLRRVAERLNLTRDPEFIDPPASLAARIVGAVKGLITDPPPAVPEDPMQKTLRALQDSVIVRRSEKTFVIDISVRTSDPDKSTRIANTIADTFVRETSEVRSDSARRSGAELNARLDQLRKRVQLSEAAVESYRRKSDLVSANGRLVTEQQLADLNVQLTLARTRAAEQEARIAEVRRMGSGGNAADAMAEVSSSPTIVALRSQYTDAARAEAEARLNYGPRHPAMMVAEKQLQTLRQRIAEEVGRLTRTAQSDVERARASEGAIAKRIDALKREASTSSEAQVRLRELERQATADRTVYESFLNRAKDLEERQTLDTGNARVITQAVPPTGRSGASRALLVAGGVMFGAMMGLGLALLRDQFDGTIRSSQQVAAETRLPVLAIRPDETVRDAGIRRMRGLLTPAAQNGPARLVVVTGLGEPASRARLTQLLACISNADGERTFLIDGDLDARTLTQQLQAEHSPGLTDVLATSSEATAPTPRSFNGLQVITAGTLPAGDVTVSVRTLRLALDPYFAKASLIVIDAGTLGPNLRGFAALADDILIVVESGKTAMRDLSLALESLSMDVERIRGIVLSGAVEA